MTLYEMLIDNGFNKMKIPVGFWDRMAVKFKIIKKIYRPKYKESSTWLIKKNISVCFDTWHVDVHRKDLKERPLITFTKHHKNTDIVKFLEMFN